MTTATLDGDSAHTLKLPEGKTDCWVWDEALPGFAMRLRPKRRTWVAVNHRLGRRFTIGRVGVLSADEARREAKKILAAFELGRDPIAERRARKYRDLEQWIAQKFSRLARLQIEPRCYLYRQYGPTGDLLYAGVSLEPLRRQRTLPSDASVGGFIGRPGAQHSEP